MSAAAQPRQRVAFEVNLPVEIQLDGDGNPTEQPSRNGDQEYRYFLRHYSIMWVPPEVHDAIQRAQAGPNACFALTKHRAPKPWSVVHLEDEPATAATQPTPISQPRQQRYNPPQSEEAGALAAQRAMQPAPTPAAQQPAPLAPPAQLAPTEKQPDTRAYYTALCAAVQTAAAGEKYAQQIGRPVAFDSADIRAMATTLFLEQQGGR